MLINYKSKSLFKDNRASKKPPTANNTVLNTPTADPSLIYTPLTGQTVMTTPISATSSSVHPTLDCLSKITVIHAIVHCEVSNSGQTIPTPAPLMSQVLTSMEYHPCSYCSQLDK